MRDQLSFRSPEGQLWIIATLAYVLLLPALIYFPTLFGHAEGVRSAAQLEGYHNPSAHLIAVCWILLTTSAFAFATRTFQPDWLAPTESASRSDKLLKPYVLPLITAIGLILLYFPPALAEIGTRYEEKIHLTTTHRMMGGDVPYRDFEFLYGPLMLYPTYWWLSLTSYSYENLFWYVLALEIVVLLAVLVPIQKYAKGRLHQVFCWLIIASLYFNPLLGPNQNGLRKAVGALLLIHLAYDPYRPRYWVIRGIILGLLLSYSQEFGVATAIGITAVYGAIYFKRRNLDAVKALFVTGAVSAVSWGLTVFALLGPNAITYFHELAALSSQFNAGEGAFRFYWTASSLSIFAIVGLGCMFTGLSLSRKWTREPAMSDLLVIGGLAYAAVMLKSGLSRADQWHIAPAVLPLVFAILLFFKSRFFALPRYATIIGTTAVIGLSLTYSYGQWPMMKHSFLNGSLPGYGSLISGDFEPIEPDPAPAYPATVYSIQNSKPDLIDVSRFLAEEKNRGRRVLTYDRAWHYAFRLGVLKTGHMTDNFIYGEERGHDTREMLEQSPDVFVFMFASQYEELLQPPKTNDQKILQESRQRRLGGRRAILSSPHYSGAYVERYLRTDRWRRLIGEYVIEQYEPVFQNESFVVLEQRPGGAK